MALVVPFLPLVKSNLYNLFGYSYSFKVCFIYNDCYIPYSACAFTMSIYAKRDMFSVLRCLEKIADVTVVTTNDRGRCKSELELVMKRYT